MHQFTSEADWPLKIEKLQGCIEDFPRYSQKERRAKELLES
jgi:hypothetical protein